MNGKSIYKATHHSCEGAPKLTSFLWHDGKSDGFVWSYNVDNTVPVAWNMVEVIGWCQLTSPRLGSHGMLHSLLAT